MGEQFPREAFLADGRRVRALGLTNGKYVVELGQLGAYGDDESLYYDGVSLEPAIFDSAPVPALDSRVQQLKSEEDALRVRLGSLREEVRKAEADHKARLAKLQKFEPLRYLESYIEGAFTHAVMTHYSNIEIATFEDALRPNKDDWGRRDDGLKLLTLFGSTKGDLQWRVNYYTDGSGSNTNVWLCMSLEEAQELAQRQLNDKCAEAVREKRIWTADGAAASAKKYGLTIPADFAELRAAYLKETLQGNVDRVRGELEKAEKALREVIS